MMQTDLKKSGAARLKTAYQRIVADDVEIFYREAGLPERPVVLLLHGFPSSSHMFRGLIPLLAERYHVVAPDLPGFGQSAMPDRGNYQYTFASISDTMAKFT